VVDLDAAVGEHQVEDRGTDGETSDTNERPQDQLGGELPPLKRRPDTLPRRALSNRGDIYRESANGKFATRTCGLAGPGEFAAFLR